MKEHRIAVIPGDGIGREVIPEGVRVLEAVGAKHGIRLNWTEFDWSCLAVILLAAKAVAPPKMKNTAMDDITFAYVSRWRICFTEDLLDWRVGQRRASRKKVPTQF